MRVTHSKIQSTVALEQSALVEFLGELKLTDVAGRIKRASKSVQSIQTRVLRHHVTRRFVQLVPFGATEGEPRSCDGVHNT